MSYFTGRHMESVSGGHDFIVGCAAGYMMCCWQGLVPLAQHCVQRPKLLQTSLFTNRII